MSRGVEYFDERGEEVVLVVVTICTTPSAYTRVRYTFLLIWLQFIVLSILLLR